MSKMLKNNVKTLVSIVFFWFFVCYISFAKRGEQELVLADSDIYNYITAMCLEQGIWDFSDNIPCTIEELRFYMEEIDYDKLSLAGKIAYDKAIEYFEESKIGIESDLLSVGVEPKFSLEGYIKSNDDVDWNYDRYQREPLIDMPMSIACADYFSIVCDLYLGLNRSEILEDDCYTSIPLDADSIDVNFPTTAYFSTGHKLTRKTGITFQLGMADNAIGRTLTGSVIKSEYMTGATYGLFSAYSRNIKFTTSVQQLNVDRFFYYHKLDVRFFKKFTFTALEGQLVAHSMELRFLNPYTIFHGFSPWRDYSEEEDTHTCAFMAAKMVYVPIKYVRLYGLFAMTQFQTPYETSNWGDSLTPNGMGGQFGIESYIPVKKGYIHSWLEFYYAQPYLYLKPTQEATMVRAYREDIGDTKRVNYEWIGSPFGPDTIAGSAYFGYEEAQKFKIALKYLFCASGQLSSDIIFNGWYGNVRSNKSFFSTTTGEYNYEWLGYPTNKHERDRKSPSGTIEYTNTISLHFDYNLTKNIQFMTQPAWTFVFNTDHARGDDDTNFEIAVAVRIKLFSKQKDKVNE